MNILAIDQGTSGTKAVVWSPDDGIVSEADVVLRPRYLPDGGVEQDPHALLQSVLNTGRTAVQAAGGRAVDAVALANQGETVLAWDPVSGDALSPAIVWQDRRAQPIVDALRPHAAQLRRRTGLALDPYFTAPKMAWLRRQVTGGVVTTTDTWIVHHLTGAFVTDRSTASRSLVVDLDGHHFDPELLELFDLQAEKLPEIVACDAVVGTTNAFGPPGLPVAGLIVDQAAALFAEGCTDPGLAKCTFGTGAFLLANLGKRPVATEEKDLTVSVAWQARGATTYCADGQAYTAASAVRWMQDLRLIDEAADLDRVALPDAADLLCVPALAGLAAPWWRADAQGALTGLTLSTQRGHVVTAVLQGIAAQVAEILTRAESALDEPLARLRVDGGLTRCRTLMQAQADIAQVPVDVFPSPNATAIGAAAMARLALEPDLAPAEAVGAWTPTASYEPQWSADRAATFRDRWGQLVATSLILQEET